jgi:hypothetical protein
MPRTVSNCMPPPNTSAAVSLDEITVDHPHVPLSIAPRLSTADPRYYTLTFIHSFQKQSLDVVDTHVEGILLLTKAPLKPPKPLLGS